MAARQVVRKDETQLQLEEKTLQLLSVQRNYDTMSRMMQAKQREQDEVRVCRPVNEIFLGLACMGVHAMRQ